MTTTGDTLTRSRSRSTDHNERLEPQLLRAAENDDVERLRELIQSAQIKGQLREHHLRIALMRSSEKGKIGTTKYLLSEGAPPDGASGNRLSPLLRAVEQKHTAIVHLLLEHGANTETVDKKGRTALMTAAWKNQWHILNSLLAKGADVNRKDNQQRNVLHNLAADEKMDWGDSVIELLLNQNIQIDGDGAHDNDGRTPLHWACATGKKRLALQLLARPRGQRVYIDSTEKRGKTSLHIATAHNRDDIVDMLLENGANLHARSDGAWTPLHNACKIGSEKIVRILIVAGSDANAKLLNGMSPLHIAAEGGFLEVVKFLLTCPDIKRAARDSFGSTPFLRAAQNRRKDIVELLAPSNNIESMSEDALGACKGFDATIVNFGNFKNENQVSKKSVYELLYGRDKANPRKQAISILPNDKATTFRWIHLPANNMAWVEALLTKLFIEEGASDIQGFKALERSFSHQHRGKQSHSHFMRPLCQSTPRVARVPEVEPSTTTIEQPPPTIFVNGGPATSENGHPRAPTRTTTLASSDDKGELLRMSSNQSNKDQSKGTPKDKSKKASKGSKSPKIGSQGSPQTPSKDHSRKSSHNLSNNRNTRSSVSPARKEASPISKGNSYTFMPYLHFETNQRCQEMKEAIKRAEWLMCPDPPHLIQARNCDEMLIRAHLATSTVSLHVRRTLDQSFYHNIDTHYRDQDQVVYRYQTKDRPLDEGADPKIVMVDQMWMWVLGKNLVVTAFPQRWQQPKNDPLNVLDSIIEDINDKTREPVQSVYDLAMIVTSRCSGVFDRHRMGDEEYQFLDMFESSIGNATDKETKLFQEFNDASAQASAWLRHRNPNRNISKDMRQASRLNNTQDGEEPTEDYDFEDFMRGPIFIDKLLDIGQETDLLAETKDIRDELNMIKKVLEDQHHVLPSLEASICDIYKEEQKSQQEVKKRFSDQLKMVGMHIKDIDRMDKQAQRIYDSITDMLDLKQKHANAFEARFARDQATSTARQSQTIMVFTIVTIVFLPMSFIASFFTINIAEFPREGGNLAIGYVSKYMFGIGLSISIPMIFIAFYLDEIAELLKNSRNGIKQWRRRKKERKEFDDEGIDGSTIEVLRLEEVLSGARSARKSVENNWVLERPSTSARPATAGSVRREKPTGFRMRMSGDVERGFK
ncbi:Ankyrin-3 [Lachnellula suecica]|uniref:Ankyrin-3 n=1 Tax=Lachnellula suecica TaxID=602035 RepID=A0A8T9CH60_9HELO|nr:Ankyrin-3 [Lachnellula suecica]